MNWLRCNTCHHCFTEHYWAPDGLALVFANAQSSQVLGSNPNEVLMKRESCGHIAALATRLLGGYGAMIDKKSVWLDVGIGSGDMVGAAAEFGFNAVGVDVREVAVEAAKSIGLQAMLASFEDIDASSPSADVLSMMDVLEHLPFPKQALLHAHAILKPGGVLMISLPNMQAMDWRVMDKHSVSPYWQELEHHHNFTLPRLRNLLKETGFDVVEVRLTSRYRSQIEVYAARV